MVGKTVKAGAWLAMAHAGDGGPGFGGDGTRAGECRGEARVKMCGNAIAPEAPGCHLAGMLRWIFVVGLIGSMALANESASFTGGLAAGDFQAAGLHKLTAAERRVLDDLIAGRERTVATAAVEAATSRIAPEDRIDRGASGPRERVESRLVGPFTGWNGRTIFRLENGQRWQQIDGDAYRAVGAPDNAAVTLTPSSFGGYFLKVEGFGSRVRVKLLSD